MAIKLVMVVAVGKFSWLVVVWLFMLIIIVVVVNIV